MQTPARGTPSQHDSLKSRKERHLADAPRTHIEALASIKTIEQSLQVITIISIDAGVRRLALMRTWQNTAR